MAAKPLYTAFAINPSTGETERYVGTRPVTCATFARGYRNFTNRYTGRKYVKDWTVVTAPDTENWKHVGWSTQDFLKAQKAAHGTNPYYAATMAVMVVDLDELHAKALIENEAWTPAPVAPQVCGFAWVAEIQLCVRCGLDASAHVGFPSRIDASPQIAEGDTVTVKGGGSTREWLVTYVEPGTGLVCLELAGDGVTVRPAAKHRDDLTLVRKAPRKLQGIPAGYDPRPR